MLISEHSNGWTIEVKWVDRNTASKLTPFVRTLNTYNVPAEVPTKTCRPVGSNLTEVIIGLHIRWSIPGHTRVYRFQIEDRHEQFRVVLRK